MLTDRIVASSVTFRDEPLEGALHHIRALGFNRLDLTAIRHFCDHFDPLLVDVGEDECVRIHELIARYEMETVSLTTYPANPLAHDINGDDWSSGIDAYVRLGLQLHAQYMVLPPGRPAPAANHWRGAAEHVKPWLREGVRRVVNAKMHPSIALQSDSLLRTSNESTQFLQLLGSTHVGLAVDPAHLAAVGEDPAVAIRHMGKAINFLLLRDTDGRNFNLPPGSGSLDYPAILTAVEEIGYDGPVVLAIDDITLSVNERSDLLLRGWEYLFNFASQRKAA
ncbi:MAG TPA: sugar phosphate isomerase/epimerase [Armatimonadota bacterium]|nr:sugar phosphate isomerase/epimerase [Armatimonadota bacterium]